MKDEGEDEHLGRSRSHGSMPPPTPPVPPILQRPERDLTKGPIVIGVCAMRKKAKSKPMMEMLDRLTGFAVDGRQEFATIFFDEETILHKPVEEWPLCEALIAFFSTGFPLHKAQGYAQLHPSIVVFNDLKEQEVLHDRRLVYQRLQENGVPVPTYTVYNAEEAATTTVEESEDYLEINGVRINKPLVEKPISGEDHNICLYYPRSQGGGCKRLFRKVADRSAEYYPDEHQTRIRDGNSYIYEELLQTEGTDVKVYAVGREYAHAEARKSPVVDGKVMRNVRGFEQRYPVILTAAEKAIARTVVLAFGQTLCGFDLLRSNGNSYVCDVNGWSFVKDSQRFWDDSANLFRQYTLEQLAPMYLARHPQPAFKLVRSPLLTSIEGPSGTTSSAGLPGGVTRSLTSVIGADADQSELLCVVAFIRHGDRTPKQKLKFLTREPSLLSMITEHGSSARDELKIKKVRLMELLLERVEAIVDRLVAEARGRVGAGAEAPEGQDVLEYFLAVKQVLKSHPFSGINRKVQLKPTQWVSSEGAGGAESSGGSSSGLGAEEAHEHKERPSEAMFILKWGGELTELGEAQAAVLGTRFRNTLYPEDNNGVLRLHSTYRHDLKIYSSDEGRVQMTAAAFAKGLLDLEGRLTPILASLVSKHESITQMLDETPADGRALMDASKATINRVLTTSERMLSSGHEGAAVGIAEAKAAKPPTAETEGEQGTIPASPWARPPPRATSTERLSKRPEPIVLPARVLSASDLGGEGGEGVAVDTSISPQRSSPAQLTPPSTKAAALRAATMAGMRVPMCKSDSQDGWRSTEHQPTILHQLLRLVDEYTSQLRERADAVGKAEILGDHAEIPVSKAEILGLMPAAAPAPAIPTDGDATVEHDSVDAATEPSPAPDSVAPPAPALPSPANDETALLHYGRWAKLKREFYKPKKGQFDTTKIPDLYDNAVYDMLHNQHLGLQSLPPIYAIARALAAYVVPQEYGTEPVDKVKVGICIGARMLHKLRRDLLAGTNTDPDGTHEQERVHQLDHSVSTDVRSRHRHVRTRLYFTSESHIHSLFNVLRWGSGAMPGAPSIFSEEAHAHFHDVELSYLTHIVLRVLLNKQQSPRKKSSYRVQVLVSPGIDHHQSVCDAAERMQSAPSEAAPAPAIVNEALKYTEQLVLASSGDLTLEEVDSFLANILRDTSESADVSRHPTNHPSNQSQMAQAKERGRLAPSPLGTRLPRSTTWSTALASTTWSTALAWNNNEDDGGGGPPLY